MKMILRVALVFFLCIESLCASEKILPSNATLKIAGTNEVRKIQGQFSSDSMRLHDTPLNIVNIRGALRLNKLKQSAIEEIESVLMTGFYDFPSCSGSACLPLNIAGHAEVFFTYYEKTQNAVIYLDIIKKSLDPSLPIWTVMDEPEIFDEELVTEQIVLVGLKQDEQENIVLMPIELKPESIEPSIDKLVSAVTKSVSLPLTIDLQNKVDISNTVLEEEKVRQKDAKLSVEPASVTETSAITLGQKIRAENNEESIEKQSIEQISSQPLSSKSEAKVNTLAPFSTTQNQSVSIEKTSQVDKSIVEISKINTENKSEISVQEISAESATFEAKAQVISAELKSTKPVKELSVESATLEAQSQVISADLRASGSKLNDNSEKTKATSQSRLEAASPTSNLVAQKIDHSKVLTSEEAQQLADNLVKTLEEQLRQIKGSVSKDMLDEIEAILLKDSLSSLTVQTKPLTVETIDELPNAQVSKPSLTALLPADTAG